MLQYFTAATNAIKQQKEICFLFFYAVEF